MIAAVRKKEIHQQVQDAITLLIDKHLCTSIDQVFTDDCERSYACGVVGRYLLFEGLIWLTEALEIEENAEVVMKIEQRAVAMAMTALNKQRKKQGKPPLRLED